MSTAALLRTPACRPPLLREMPIGFDADLSQCSTYRWSLRRWFSSGWFGPERVLPWIMLNPSTADEKANDPTLCRIIRWTWTWGFDGLLVVNLFPYRSPDPRELARWIRWDERQDWVARDALQENWTRAARLLLPYDAAMVAWGAPAGALAHDAELGAESFFDTVNDPDGDRDRMPELFCLGTTQGGRPIHPMARGRHRVPDGAKPRPFGRQPGTIGFEPYTAPSTQIDLP